MKVIKPPHPIPENGFLIFTAGSIEMGAAEPWADYVAEALKDSNAVLLNPRRNFWDAGWKASADDKNFSEQVNWELDGQEKADLIIMYFDPNTKSPISLLELGLFGRDGKMIVCCPEGFWKKGNVDLVCQRYGIQQVDSLDGLIEEVKKKLYPSIENIEE